MNCYKDSYLEKPKTKIHKTDLFDVEAGTNGYQGGDAGYGGTTYFRIENTGGCISVDINKEKEGFEIAVGGDWELRCIIEALEFIIETLKKQSETQSETQTVEESLTESIDWHVQHNSEYDNLVDFIAMKLVSNTVIGSSKEISSKEIEALKLLYRIYKENK